MPINIKSIKQIQMNSINIKINTEFHNLFDQEDNFYGTKNQDHFMIEKQDKAISPWFQQKPHFNQIKQINKQKPLILDFLSTLRERQNSFRSKIIKKSKIIDPTDKSEILYQLNSTVIAFPKSICGDRQQHQEDAKIFQKHFKKRQRSKIIPKELKLIEMQSSPQKFVKHLSYLKKNKSPDFKDLRQRKLYEVGQLSPILKRKNQNGFSKVKRSSSMNQVQQKFYKTLNFQKMVSKTRNQLIQKAKISHLNRNPQIQTLQMHCMGSTISNWNNLRSTYLNKIRK